MAADPERFFVPSYVGAKGWVGVNLDGDDLDWEELVEEIYRLIVPNRLVRDRLPPGLPAGGAPPASSRR